MIEALMQLLSQLAPQHWLILGLALLIAEMASGTTYLLWPAVAAFLTALLAWAFPMDWGVELGVFAALVIGLTAFGRPLVQRWRGEGEANGLNERGAGLIGVRAVLTEFADGIGAVKIGDTVWRASSGENLAAGDSVEIAGIDGTTLRVTRAD